MMTRAEIMAEARAWLGVKYRQKGRSRESGLDCIGLLVVVGRAFAVPHQDHNDYADHPDNGRRLLAEFDRVLALAPPTSPWPGTIGVFTDSHLPCHCGIFSERFGVVHLIHAMLGRRIVLEEPFRASAFRLVRRYQFPALED
jgi:cell wall-associated NlpC family hydrolase